jgi:hypothetical protein
MTTPTPEPSNGRRNTATMLVEIAEEIWTFGCTSSGDTFAAPVNNSEQQIPLPEVRPLLAAMFQAAHGRVPAGSALGDAMTTLEGRARRAEPTEATNRLLSLLGGTASKATQLVQMARERYRFGVTPPGEVFAVPADGPNIARALRGGRRSLRNELAQAYYAETGTAANAQALADALLVLQGEAQGADPAEVALRVGRDTSTGNLVLDLGRDDGQVVVISPAGWEITHASPVLFWRTNATLPLPLPQHGGDLGSLRALLNLPSEDWPLIVSWAVAALFPDIPHPVLAVRGEHGSAKSSLVRLITSLIDKCASQLRTAPRNVEDWAVACAGSWVTCLDNVSHMPDWVQDAICRAVTGDGLLRRERYTDSDVAVLAFRRVVAVTGIDLGPINGDLADRLLNIEPHRILKDGRAPEQDVEARWRAAHPVALGALLDLTSDVLSVHPSVRRTDLPRMADFARIVLAVDQVLGTNGYQRYAQQAGNIAQNVAESDSVIIRIKDMITTKWVGSAQELLDKITPDRPPRDWPTTPQGMGGRLSRAAPTLRELGWVVEQDRTKRSRTWTLQPPQDLHPAQTSPMAPVPPDQVQHGGNLSDGPVADAEGNVTGSATGDDINPAGSAARDYESPGQDKGDIGDDPAGQSSTRLGATDPAVDNSGPLNSGARRSASGVRAAGPDNFDSGSGEPTEGALVVDPAAVWLRATTGNRHTSARKPA